MCPDAIPCVSTALSNRCVFVCVSVSVCVNERERHENERKSDNTDVSSTCELREY